LVALAPFVLSTPYVGVLVWSWLSFMSPQRETFGDATTSPIVFVAALATLIAWLISRRPRPILFERTALLLIAFALWTGVSTLNAIDINISYPAFLKASKTFALALTVLALINTKARVQALIWVIAVSLGYYAVKGAGFTLATGGIHHVFGPEGSAIADNNTLGAALVMTLPLLNYLRLSSRRLLVSGSVSVVMFATVLAVIGTYSRGGLIGLAIVGITMWLRSRHKLILTAGVAAVLITLPAITPADWYKRMSSIESYSSDPNFAGRVEAWGVSARLALDRPLTGGGFKAIELDSVSARYSTGLSLLGGRAAHSIYFQVLGEHGFVGLGLYVLLLIVAFLNLSSVVHAAKRRADLRWMTDLAGMLQVSLITMLSVGALLSMAYYDVLIVLLALSARLRLLVQEPDTPDAASAGAGWRRSVQSRE
jgi:probable O-glycosylation ligase (exosortase A-associated)